jgi:tRNA (cmo5U34)-methyltransferase
VASYAADAARNVPGLADLHRMAALLLAEAAPPDGQVLVLGAGGGLELRALAGMCPGWRFTGVDPSAAMLDLAREACAGVADRIGWLTGTIDQAPPGPFDGATCLLTLHFLDRAERQRTLAEVRRRLRPGARLVVAHHAGAGHPGGPGQRDHDGRTPAPAGPGTGGSAAARGGFRRRGAVLRGAVVPRVGGDGGGLIHGGQAIPRAGRPPLRCINDPPDPRAFPGGLVLTQGVDRVRALESVCGLE